MPKSTEVYQGVPWEGCKHQWSYDGYIYHPIWKCHFPYYRRCLTCGAKEYRRSLELDQVGWKYIGGKNVK